MENRWHEVVGGSLRKRRSCKKNWETISEKTEDKLLAVATASHFFQRQSPYFKQSHCYVGLDPLQGLQIHRSRRKWWISSVRWPTVGVLLLAREDGGQGVIHLASATATFRLQFIQRYITGIPDLVWRVVTSCILRYANKVGFDDVLFLSGSKF